MQARNDVPEEWRNLPDMKGLQEQARKLDDMIEKGDDADLEKALAQLGDDLRGMRKMLDQNLDGFGAERFPQENRVVADLMKKIGDIEGDERALQKETQAISEKQEAEVERRLKGQMDELLKREGDKIDRLKQKLASVPTGDPESALSEEIDRARESAKQMRRLLAERDLAEAKGEAERAETSLERAGEHLDELAEARRARHGGVEAEHDKRADAVGEARGLAQEIADDLVEGDAEALGDADAGRSRGGARAGREAGGDRQAHRRAGRGGGPAARQDAGDGEGRGGAQGRRRAHEGGGRVAQAGRIEAGRHRRARRRRPARASCATRCRSGRWAAAEQHHDPVRIPGADESSAPRAWRQELLDAMKETGARALPRRGPPLLRGAGQMRRGPDRASPLGAAFARRRRRRARGQARPRAAPPRARPTPTGAAAKQVDELLDAWQFKEAAAALATLKSVGPGRPRRPASSTATRSSSPATTTARSRRSPPRLRRRSRPTARSSRSRSWPPPRATPSRTSARSARPTRSSTTRPRTPRSSPMRATPSRRPTRALHADLGFEIAQPIRVEFYRAPSDLAAVSSLSVAEVARTGTIALCKWARLMVTTPRALAYGYPWLDSMNHELVHYAVSTLSKDRAPVWLQEGLAKFLERRWREPPGGRIPPPMEHLLAKALRSGHLISFEAMHPSMAKLPSAEDATLAFAEVENAVAYLYEKGGMAALRDAIKRVGDGEDARAGGGGRRRRRLARVRARLARLHGWRSTTRPSRPSTSRPPTSARPNAIASGRKPAEEDALSPAPKASAPFRYLRLGNMLLGRDHPRAAAAEYEKGAEGGHRQRAQRSLGDLGLPGEAGANLPGARRARARAQGAGPGAGALPRSPLAEPHRGRGAAGAGRRAGRRHLAARVAGDQPVRPARPLRARRGVREVCRPSAPATAADDRARAAALQRAGRRITASAASNLTTSTRGRYWPGWRRRRCRTSVKTNGGRFDEKAPTPLSPRWSRALRGHSRLRADRAAAARHRTATEFGTDDLRGGGGIGIGAVAFLSGGLTGGQFVYDQAMFHVEALLGYQHISPPDNGGSDLELQIRRRPAGITWPAASNSDFSIGGCAGLLYTSPARRQFADPFSLEPGAEARVFLTPNFALSGRVGFAITFGDNNSDTTTSRIARPGNGQRGSASPTSSASLSSRDAPRP